MTTHHLILSLLSMGLALVSVPTHAAETIKPRSDTIWQPLIPARGDKSPQAGMLWGDIKETGASGFLVKFKDGFSSPPHIHNVTYRGVVISGQIHNDDPEAAKLWMPKGSFWTQPAGESHITAAQGEQNIAYIEIDSGPYLVKPKDNAFDNGERPVNIVPSNLIWLNASNIHWAGKAGEKVEIAFLWGSPEKDEPHGTLLKFPVDFTGSIATNASEFRAVVIQGALNHSNENSATLPAGSYFSSHTPTEHSIATASDESTILYIRSNDTYEINTKEQ